LLVTNDEGEPMDIGLTPPKDKSTNSRDRVQLFAAVGFEPDGIKYMRLATAIQ